MQHRPPWPAADRLIATALRSEQAPWPEQASSSLAEDVLRRAAFHGVSPLLQIQPGIEHWPENVRQGLRQAVIQHAVWEMRHQSVLSAALAHLHGAGLRPVLLKGTALAYSLYADPTQRPRSDTDLIVAPGQRERANDALVESGFYKPDAVSGDFISYQASYLREVPEGAAHTIDLHWKINNSELLSRLFTHDELLADSQPLPALFPLAVRCSFVHALLIACMHRSTHKQNPYQFDGVEHHDANRMIWLWDIHLLAARLSGEQWQRAVALAHAKGLRAVCLDGLQQAQNLFGPAAPTRVLEQLAAAGRHELPAKYLESGPLQQQWMDFSALGAPSSRLRFVRELMFPSREYMRSKFPDARIAWLPWLYLRRTAQGIARRLGRQLRPPAPEHQ